MVTRPRNEGAIKTAQQLEDSHIYILAQAIYFIYACCCVTKKGRKSFKHIRTVDGEVYATNRARAACEAMGLLGNDQEWNIALEEASLSAVLVK